MKIIEIINLIAQGIEPPKHIRYCDDEFTYIDVGNGEYDYVSDYNGYIYLIGEYIGMNKEDLNQVVKIIDRKCLRDE